MIPLRIGIVRGGLSDSYRLSLESGSNLLNLLRAEGYQPLDILITKDRTWHLQGVARSPFSIFSHLDLVINAIHGDFVRGFGKEILDIMELSGAPYTGSKYLPSAMSASTHTFRDYISKSEIKNIKFPKTHIIRAGEDIEKASYDIFRSFPMPALVRPAQNDTKTGDLASSFLELKTLIRRALCYSATDAVLVEEQIGTAPIICGALDGFRGEKTYTTPPSEIFQDGSIKSPLSISFEAKQEIARITREIHKYMGCRHYSISEFSYTPKRGVYFIKLHTHPTLKERAPLFSMLETTGGNASEFIHHLVLTSLHQSH